MRVCTLSLGCILTLACTAHAQPRIELKDMLIPDKELGEKFQRIHAAAEKMAGPKWDRLPYKSLGEYKGRGVYYADWASFRPDDTNGPFNYQGPEELSYVQLGAFYFKNAKDPDALRKIIGLTLHTRWKPANSGWNAFVIYRTYNGQPDPATTNLDESFNIRWHYHPLPEAKSVPAGLELNLHGQANYGTAYRTGGFLYLIHSYTKPAVDKPQVPDRHILRLLASPEALRDQLLADHEALLKHVRAEIKAGRFASAQFDRPAPPGKQPDLAKAIHRPLNETETAELLNQAERDIGGKIESIRNHYKELHAAALRAFPIRECLLEVKGR